MYATYNEDDEYGSPTKAFEHVMSHFNRDLRVCSVQWAGTLNATLTRFNGQDENIRFRVSASGGIENERVQRKRTKADGMCSAGPLPPNACDERKRLFCFQRRAQLHRARLPNMPAYQVFSGYTGHTGSRAACSGNGCTSQVANAHRQTAHARRQHRALTYQPVCTDEQLR